ncbi:MAG: ABC transporter permease [Candidatus Latescibacterota bacterium]|nr:MAG: ABC transporter permease [Candidatus Latescibacterota bacterium]
MSRMIAIYLRELGYLFNSIIAYIVMMIFTLLAGYFFYNLLAFFNLASIQMMQNPLAAGELSLTEGVLQPLFGNMSIVLLLTMPMLTMRLLSEERKLGTAELLFTCPISDWDAILGKYFAAATVLATMLVLTFVFPWLLSRYAAVEWGAVTSGYLGLLFLGMAYLAMGLFFSSITENQIVAGILSFGFSLLFLIIGWINPFVSEGLSRVIAQVSILEHFGSFSAGIIDTNDIVYYFCFSLFFLFLCSRVLESNRWRG